MVTMKRAALDGVDLEYEVRGSGEPIVFVHHGAGVEWFARLVEEPALAVGYSLIRYRRAGYGGSSALGRQRTFADEASHFAQLMSYLNLERAHVVGHSAAGCIALQIALDAGERVQSLALLEPALLAVPSPPEVPRAIELFRAGDKTAAVETFLRGTCGPDARVPLEKAIPGAFNQALASADTFFTDELPALRRWTFGPEEAKRVLTPVLAVVGEKSDDRFRQRQQLLLEWLPDVEEFVLPGAGHLLHLQNSRAMAAALAWFFARHSRGAVA